MADRPAPVRIHDLVAPEYPPEIAGAFDAVKPMVEQLDWSVDGVLRAAATKTGLDDFGDDLHVEPLAVALESFTTDAHLSTLGQLSVHDGVVRLLSQRALVADLLRRHPEIHEIEIKSPIVIAGQARTGTTHLHNLMSSDPSFRSMPYWESVEPVPPLNEQGNDYGPDAAADPRYVRCAESLSSLNTVLPYFKRMHDMYPEHVHEEIALLGVGFGGMQMETMGAGPMWRDWYLQSDQTPHFAFLKTMLQVLTFLRGGERWLLKSPQHVEQLGPLMTVFPDAIVVCTHREPAAVAQSVATMLTYTARMRCEPRHLADVGRYWIDRMEIMFAAMERDRHLVPEAQSIDVRFDDFMADDVAMVRRIYEVADHPFSAETKAGMDNYMVEHPRGVHGSVTYAMEEDFGVSKADFASRTASYSTRFNV